MAKKNNKYKIRLEEIELKSEELEDKTIDFEFENHDDIFHIIKLIQAKRMFQSDNEDIEFAVGLKLFSEVMLKNRKNEVFQEFLPHFSDFMKVLKSR